MRRELVCGAWAGVAAIGASAVASGDFASPFFAEVISNNGDNVPLLGAERAAAEAAQALFKAALVEHWTESFEGFNEGHDFSSESMTLPFGAGPDAEITRGRVREVAAGQTNGEGRYATDGTKFLSANVIANGSFTLSFDTPQSALGFYGIDLGDWGGQLRLIFELAAGGQQIVDVEHSIHTDGDHSGSMFFWGVVDAENPFTSVEFTALGSDERDVFAFDELILGVPVPLPTPAHLALGGLLACVAVRRRRH